MLNGYFENQKIIISLRIDGFNFPGGQSDQHGSNTTERRGPAPIPAYQFEFSLTALLPSNKCKTPTFACLLPAPLSTHLYSRKIQGNFNFSLALLKTLWLRSLLACLYCRQGLGRESSRAWEGQLSSIAICRRFLSQLPNPVRGFGKPHNPFSTHRLLSACLSSSLPPTCGRQSILQSFCSLHSLTVAETFFLRAFKVSLVFFHAIQFASLYWIVWQRQVQYFMWFLKSQQLILWFLPYLAS